MPREALSLHAGKARRSLRRTSVLPEERVTRVTANACASFFSAATGPGGKEPGDTLAAVESIARSAAYKPQRTFALLESFYRIPQGKKLRVTPFLPYLSFAPSA